MSRDAQLAKKSLGQHWLNDESTLEYICGLAELSSTDSVLEIGPGLGSLTRLLINKAGQVIAVEIDNNLSNKLINTLKSNKLRVINDSILKFDLTTLPVDYKLVANIPYYLTNNLLKLLSETSNPPRVIVLLVQKEVAQRVAAKPGDMSLLSVTTQFYWEVSLKRIVPAKMFEPQPKVDSQIILLNRRSKPVFKNIDSKAFFRLVKIGFSARRKTLLNSMTGGLRITKEEAESILKIADINPSLRPQMLDLDQWHEIYKVCLTKKVI